MEPRPDTWPDAENSAAIHPITPPAGDASGRSHDTLLRRPRARGVGTAVKVLVIGCSEGRIGSVAAAYSLFAVEDTAACAAVLPTFSGKTATLIDWTLREPPTTSESTERSAKATVFEIELDDLEAGHLSLEDRPQSTIVDPPPPQKIRRPPPPRLSARGSQVRRAWGRYPCSHGRPAWQRKQPRGSGR